MGGGSLDVFSAITAAFDPALTTAVTTIVSNAIAATAGIFGTALTLFVITQGMLIMWGQIGWSQFAANIGRAAAIALLLTAAFYGPYIQTMFMTTIPDWIARSTTGSAASDVSSQFSNMSNAAEKMAAGIYAKASGLWYIAERMEVYFVLLFIEFVLVVDFFFWEITKWLVDILVAAGPFLIWLGLFKTTRHVPERWFGKLLGVMLLYMLVNVTMQVVIQADMQFLRMAEVTGGVGDIPFAISAMIKCLIFAIFGTIMLGFCPPLAFYIGGGVGLPAAQLGRTIAMAALRVPVGVASAVKKVT